MGRFRDWHQHVSGHHETIAPAHLFENALEQIAPGLRLQEREPAVTTEGDEVQKSVAVAAVESGHDGSLAGQGGLCL